MTRTKYIKTTIVKTNPPQKERGMTGKIHEKGKLFLRQALCELSNDAETFEITLNLGGKPSILVAHSVTGKIFELDPESIVKLAKEAGVDRTEPVSKEE